MADCNCPARFSGNDEAEYRAWGCPSCVCGKIGVDGKPLVFEYIELPQMIEFDMKHLQLWKDFQKKSIQDQMDEHMVKTSSAKRL